jgi:hypothetical protein
MRARKSWRKRIERVSDDVPVKKRCGDLRERFRPRWRFFGGRSYGVFAGKFAKSGV